MPDKYALDPDFVAAVVSDLRYVRDEWRDDVSTDALRRGATTLRGMLVEGSLQRAWKQVGLEREPLIPAVDFDVILPWLSPDSLRYAFAGNGVANSAQISSTAVWHRELPENELTQAMGKLKEPPMRDYGLRMFTESRCGVIFDLTIIRRNVIKYVANRLGSAHYGRSDRESGAEKALYDLLDATRGEASFAGHPTIYFELLSIGQALALAPDIDRFMTAADALLPKRSPGSWTA